MGIAYLCDASLRCTFTVWDGDVTPNEWSEQLDRIMSDPAFPPGPLLLSDLSSARDTPEISAAVIENMGQRWRAHAADLGSMQWAVIPDGAWDKARQFEGELVGSGIRAMIFNDPWSACSWLGLDAETARSILRELREKLRA